MGQKFFITEEEKIRIKSLYVESVETPEDQQLDKILAQAGVTLTPDEKMELSPECPMEEPPSQHAEVIDNIKQYQDNAKDNVKISLYTTISMYNIFYSKTKFY